MMQGMLSGVGKRVCIVSVIAGISCSIISCGRQTVSQHGAKVYARIPFNKLGIAELSNFDRDHKVDDEFAFGYISSSSDLANQPYTRVLDQRYESGAFDAKTLVLEDEDPIDPVERAAGYRNYAALTAELRALADKYPEISQLSSIGKTQQGREIWMMKISDNAVAEDHEPNLLYIANMHGDEVVGRELNLNLVRFLLENYADNAQIRAMIDFSQIHIIPSLNPDGFEMQTRRVDDGTDLNRNFPDFVEDPNNTTADRADETQAIMRLHQRLEFALAMNFHGGALLVNIPWDTMINSNPATKFADDTLIKSLARNYTNTNQTMYQTGDFDHGLTYGYEWFRVAGGMQDWANFYQQSVHATVEVSTNKWPPSSQLPKFWEDNRQSMINYLDAGRTGIHLQVRSADGQAIENYSVKIASSDRRTIKSRSSIMNRTTLAGPQVVTISAPGYQTVTKEINAVPFSGVHSEVILSPLSENIVRL